MAVATKPEAPPVSDTEAQTRLRQAMQDVERYLDPVCPTELAQARQDLERRWVVCSEELRRLAKPVTRRAPRLLRSEPEDPDPARAAQVQAVEHAAALLEHANHVRAQANLALFRAR